jgi:enterochelin esterase family protein
MPTIEITPNTNLVSPEVHPDGTVTFRIWAPDAKTVKVFCPEGTKAVPGTTADQAKTAEAGVPLVRTENGVWTAILGPFPPGAYRYTFQVDGVSTTDPKNSASSETLTAVRSLYLIPGNFADVNDVPHGAVASVYYQSATLGRTRRMHIYLPPGYESGNSSYPVLFLLHGAGDCDDSWTSVGRANFILDNLIAAGQAKPMIIVMPMGHVSAHFDMNTMRASATSDPFIADLMNDVIPFVEHHYRVVADPEHRAIAGLSMGGMQTLNAVIAHPGYFSYVGVFSSGWFGGTREQVEQANLASLQSPEKKAVKLFWFSSGKLDIALPNTGPAIEMLKKYGYNPEFHESEGFHEWNNWRDYLHEFAPLLFQ